MNGTALARKLPWDSEFFGFTVGQVETNTLTEAVVARVEGWAEREGVRCLYFLARSDDARTIRLAEKAGYHLVDVRLTLSYSFGRNRVYRENSSVEIQPVKGEEVPLLRSIARNSYHDSRFYFDRNFPRAQVDALYETWIAKSCAGHADAVLVPRINDKPVGYVSCHLDESLKTGKFGLVAVTQQARGKGVGSAMIQEALAWFRKRSVRQVRVVTQGRNIGAQRLYQKCGFATDTFQLWYHKWFREDG